MVSSKKSGDSNESTEEIIRKFLSKYDKILRNNLKKYDLNDLYGHIVAITFLLSVCFGTWASLQYFKDDLGLSFYATIVVISILSAFVVLPVTASVLVRLYKFLFVTTTVAKTILAYQIITLFISLALSWAIASPVPIQFGLFVFATLIFVYPMLGMIYKEKSDVNKLNKTIKHVYTIFTIVINILNFFINHGSILKLILGQ